MSASLSDLPHSCCGSLSLFLTLIHARFAADKPNDKKRRFQTGRCFPQAAALKSSLELTSPCLLLFAGARSGEVYSNVQAFSASLHLLAVHQNLKDTQRFTLKDPIRV